MSISARVIRLKGLICNGLFENYGLENDTLMPSRFSFLDNSRVLFYCILCVLIGVFVRCGNFVGLV